MPIFEPDSGRPRLVQPMQPLAGTFLGEVRLLLSEHLPAVVGEPLFLVRSRAVLPEHADAPEILALDVTGRPVVLEVAQVVDDAAIVAALRHAGAAARLTTADLARAYHPDPTRFSADYSAFREQVPFARPAELRYGTRLILLCSEVAPESIDTLSAVRGPGWPVKVLQVGVVRGPDGRRLLDVSPLAAFEQARRPVEPTALRLVHTTDANPPPPLALPDAAAATARAVPAPASTAPRPPLIPTQPPLTRPLGPSPRPLTSPIPIAPSMRPPAPLATLLATVARHDAGPMELAQRQAMASAPVAAPAPAPAPAPIASAPAPAPTPAPAAVPPPTPGPVATRPPALAAGGGPFHGPAVSSRAALPELVALAAVVRAPVALVWVRERRGQRLEATLRPDGLIQLPDGSMFADPDLAAACAAQSEGAVDGWRTWRLGDGGPTLAETLGR